jgi:hypothetical protein
MTTVQPDGTGSSPQARTPAVVGHSLFDRVLIAGGMPAAALAVALSLPWLARWLLQLPGGLPFGVVFRVIGSVDRPLEVGVNAALWLVGGGLAARSVLREDAVVLFDVDGLRVRERGREVAVARSDVADVFLDSGRLVVLDGMSRQRVRVRPQADSSTLRQAFLLHRYPWRDADPYAAAFRGWDPAEAVAPGLPAGAAELLRLRQAQVKRRAEAEIGSETESVRAALEELGVVVRNEGHTQFWRPLAAARPAGPGSPAGQP